MPKKLADIPRGLRGIYGRFQRWRNKHPQARLPISKRLWLAAAEAARENGVGRTAQALGLEYGKLKRLAEAGAVAATPAAAPATFVELIGSPGNGLSECLIELGRAAGQDARPVEGDHQSRSGRTQPDVVGAKVIQITPQMRILVAIEAVDGRKYAPSMDMRSRAAAVPRNRPLARPGTAHNGLPFGSKHGEQLVRRTEDTAS